LALAKCFFGYNISLNIIVPLVQFIYGDSKISKYGL